MNKLMFAFFAIFFCQALSAQDQNLEMELPSDYNVYSIPLWTKAVLELKETDKGKYEYRILSLEVYDEFYSFDKNENLFSENPQENTIELFFIGAFYRDGKEDQDYKTLLMLRNNLKVPLDYKADILYYFNDEFENTSIIGAFPGTKVNEIWHHRIDQIALYDFEELKSVQSKNQ